MKRTPSRITIFTKRERVAEQAGEHPEQHARASAAKGLSGQAGERRRAQCAPSLSEPMIRGAGCGKSACPDLREPREGNDPGPPDSQPLGPVEAMSAAASAKSGSLKRPDRVSYITGSSPSVVLGRSVGAASCTYGVPRAICPRAMARRTVSLFSPARAHLLGRVAGEDRAEWRDDVGRLARARGLGGVGASAWVRAVSTRRARALSSVVHEAWSWPITVRQVIWLSEARGARASATGSGRAARASCRAPCGRGR